MVAVVVWQCAGSGHSQSPPPDAMEASREISASTNARSMISRCWDKPWKGGERPKELLAKREVLDQEVGVAGNIAMRARTLPGGG